MSVCCYENENTTATAHTDKQSQVAIKPLNLTTVSEKDNRKDTTYNDSTNNHAAINVSYPWNDISQHWALINLNVRPYMNVPEYFRRIQLENETNVCTEGTFLSSYHSLEKYFVSLPFYVKMPASLSPSYTVTYTRQKLLPPEFSERTVMTNGTYNVYNRFNDRKYSNFKFSITHNSNVSKTINFTECTKTLATSSGSIEFIFTSIRSKFLSFLDVRLDLFSEEFHAHKVENISANQDVVVRENIQKYYRSSDMIKTSFSNITSKTTARCTIKRLYESSFTSNKSKIKTETTFLRTPFSNYSAVKLTKQIGNLKESSYNCSSYNGNDYNMTSLFKATSPTWFICNVTNENRTCKTNSFKTKSGETENSSNSTECVANTGYYWQILTSTKTPHVVVWTQTSEYENRDESVKTNLHKTEWLNNSITHKMFIVKTPLFTSIQQTSMTVSPDSVIVVNTSNIYNADYVTAEHYKSNATRIQNLYTSTGQPASTVNPHPITDNGTSDSTKAFELDQVFLQPTSRYYKIRMLFKSS